MGETKRHIEDYEFYLLYQKNESSVHSQYLTISINILTLGVHLYKVGRLEGPTL